MFKNENKNEHDITSTFTLNYSTPGEACQLLVLCKNPRDEII
jgi:hypothetical protein